MAFSFYHKPHTSNLELITYFLERYKGVDNVLECFCGFCSVINLPHANNVFNIINICHSSVNLWLTVYDALRSRCHTMKLFHGKTWKNKPYTTHYIKDTILH